MVFIVDDDKAIRLSMGILLGRSGFATACYESPEDAYAAIRRGDVPQVILLDMNFKQRTTGSEGLEALQKFKVLAPGVPVILITGWGSIELAVEGMRLGAYDFLTKPLDSRLIVNKLKTAIALTGHDDTPAGSKEFKRDNIIGRSEAVLKVLDTASRIAATDAPVLITGENGTGKELVAEAIHQNSLRAGKSFVKVNLGGLPTSLFESEMFGHVKGAFTGADSVREGRFAVADKGTIFLDEIGELDLSCQVKMLRVLQEQTFEPLGDSRPRKVDVRVISATNADLTTMIADRTFREDLYYRINLITLRMPPLRERREDIPLLARHFAGKAALQAGLEVPEFSKAALTTLQRWNFPGNVRELKNIVDRAVLVCRKNIIEEVDLEPGGSPAVVATGASAAGQTLDDIERAAIVSALKANPGNISKAALQLGITRQSLYRKIMKHGLDK